MSLLSYNAFIFRGGMVFPILALLLVSLSRGGAIRLRSDKRDNKAPLLNTSIVSLHYSLQGDKPFDNDSCFRSTTGNAQSVGEGVAGALKDFLSLTIFPGTANIRAILGVSASMSKIFRNIPGEKDGSAAKFYKCIESFVDKAINEAISDLFRSQIDTYSGTLQNKFDQFNRLTNTSGYNFAVQRMETLIKFNDINTPMDYMKNLFINKCKECGPVSGSGVQLLSEFSMFVTTQYFPYHLSFFTDYFALYNYNPNDPSLIASRDYLAKEVIDAYVVELRPAYMKYMDEGIRDSLGKVDWYRDDQAFTYKTWIPGPGGRGQWSFMTYQRPMFYINDLRVNGEWSDLKIRFPSEDATYQGCDERNTGMYSPERISSLERSAEDMKRILRVRAENAFRTQATHLSGGGADMWPALFPNASTKDAIAFKVTQAITPRQDGFFSDCPTCLDYDNNACVVNKPDGVPGTGFNMTSITIHSGSWIDAIEISYSNGQTRWLGNRNGGWATVISNLGSDPIVKMVVGSRRNGIGKPENCKTGGDSTVVGALQGLIFVRKSGIEIYVGDVVGDQYWGGPTYQMVDDYSYALGDVYLCGLSLHGSMTDGCSDRVHGVAPTWCAIENTVATLDCPIVNGYSVTKDRSHFGDDINCNITQIFPSVTPLARMCSDNRDCKSFQFGGVVGPSCLKTAKLTTDDLKYAWSRVCFYEKK